ncbi:mannose-6-phosphate isomerase, class I [Streptomyces spiroverticillatus]|uniref:mannose-6-phosphate isomerase n=1 Tax=Streptomyces finlayi TaxID=67296 RepID=A0A918X7N8_9ACTN|nr:mannose-6-phosphate isomerase, class I [Streptomyces finlayi]GHA41038.1 mannose-6-phosphate isomerase, class I [Streptomyces spiroverticillatus]GHD16932.1 mannose-6-phosphate isomerase, class I [Streptomyces finlayi]
MDRLANTVRPYAWGSVTAIPELLGTEPTGEPQAELWMGAHPGAPSRITRPAPGTEGSVDAGTPEPQALSDVITADPETELGTAAVKKFGPRLPFLFKVLAAGAPLSLQVHPDLAQAQEGYADEERRRVPIGASDRNYKDANHKPELICALTEFNGLCGFRVPTESADFFDALGVGSLKPYADLLRAHPEEAALREVLTAILTADRAELAATVTATAHAAARLAADPATDPTEAAAYAACADLAHHFPGDPGVLAAILLNHVRLQPGEALFLGAGVPHAYLDGLGVEIMANSDNVLRCGLTPKHVDVPELLRVVRFEATDPGVLRPEAAPDGEELYDTPIDEFRLSRYVLAQDAAPAHLPDGAPQILLCTAGTPRAGDLPLTPGESVYVPAGEKTELSGPGTVFRATVVI